MTNHWPSNLRIKAAMVCIETAIDKIVDQPDRLQAAREWLLLQAQDDREYCFTHSAFTFGLLADALFFTPAQEICYENLKGFLKLLAQLNTREPPPFIECRTELVRLGFHVTPQG